jgi:hypothetical protein
MMYSTQNNWVWRLCLSSGILMTRETTFQKLHLFVVRAGRSHLLRLVPEKRLASVTGQPCLIVTAIQAPDVGLSRREVPRTYTVKFMVENPQNGIVIQMEVIIYATYVLNKPVPNIHI